LGTWSTTLWPTTVDRTKVTADHADVVVIGAGLGGLGAACYLAKEGHRVVVLEHHSVPGGYAHDFTRKGFTFEVALHAMDGVAPGGWVYPVLRDLEVLDRVTFRRLDPFYTASYPEHQVTAHADPLAYEAELVRLFPDQAEGFRSLIDTMVGAFAETRRFQEDGELGIRPGFSDIPARYPRMVEAMATSWEQYLGRFVDDPKARAVFSTLWGYYGMPPSRLNAATFVLPWVSYHFFGAYYPLGRSMAISRALEDYLLEHGGEIRYRQTVDHIEVSDGLAVAVSTEQGLRVETDAVVSNANPRDTITFIGLDNLEDDYIKAVTDPIPSLSNLVAYLGVEGDLQEAGWPHHEHFVFETYDLEEDYRNAMEGRFADTGMVVSHYSTVDSEAAPLGSSALVAMTLAPWDHAGQWGTGGDLEGYRRNPAYRAAKDEAGKALIDRVERLVPGVTGAVRVTEIATPLTNWRYSRNTHGAIYGSEQTVDNMYLGRLPAKTPMDNVFLAGAWVTGGGMSTALMSGRATSRRVTRYLGG
jgi:prolycopene isomerase